MKVVCRVDGWELYGWQSAQTHPLSAACYDPEAAADGNFFDMWASTPG